MNEGEQGRVQLEDNLCSLAVLSYFNYILKQVDIDAWS